MNFAFSEEQLAFRDAVRDLLAAECPPAAVRASWSGDDPGWDPKLWARLGEMGVLSMLVPEDAGGLGLDEIDAVLIWEATGRAAMPGPIAEHTAVGAPAAPTAGMATFAAGPARVGWSASADVVLLAGDSGVSTVRPTAFAPLATVDRSRRDVRIDSFEEISAADLDVDLALDRMALAAAAQLCGLADHLISVTVDYVCARHQFGVPIGSYQAVKHQLADAKLLLEHARPAVYRAAYSVAKRAPTRGRDVSMAKVMAGDAAARASRAALQCHGAIGYSWEHDLHLWIKRVWTLERAWGTTDEHRERVAAAILD